MRTIMLDCAGAAAKLAACICLWTTAHSAAAIEYRLIPQGPGQGGLFEVTGGSITTNGTLGAIDRFDIIAYAVEYTLTGCIGCTDGDRVLNETNSHIDIHGGRIAADENAFIIEFGGEFLLNSAFATGFDLFIWQNDSETNEHRLMYYGIDPDMDVAERSNAEPTPFIMAAVPEPSACVLALSAVPWFVCIRRRVVRSRADTGRSDARTHSGV